MVEYLYDAIRAVAGQDILVGAYITDDEERLITEGCSIMVHGADRDICAVDGKYNPESQMWEFTIPGEQTLGLKGRYFYCIQHKDSNLCFKQPLYLV